MNASYVITKCKGPKYHKDCEHYEESDTAPERCKYFAFGDWYCNSIPSNIDAARQALAVLTGEGGGND